MKKSAAIGVALWTHSLASSASSSAFVARRASRSSGAITPPNGGSGGGRGRIRGQSSGYSPGAPHTLRALPPLNWFFHKNDDGNNEASSKGDLAGQSAKEAEAMHRTAEMMEDHRRSREAAERTAAAMDELSSALIVGKSKAGASGGINIGDGRRGGVRVTFTGERRPIGVEVDPNFLFSESRGVISVEELNEAMTDAIEDGYARSGRVMEEKMKGLYEQLGLSREPPPLPSGEDGMN
mmetsp:Transcript_3681/g.7707  ORF Transcript_3681/g.7707 Transcript_3681/m.7707 type:complete len:238 (+) Transcript_3681:199-912(+)